MTLHNRSILLVGGSGGLGTATARLLAAESAALTISYHSNESRAAALQDVADIVQADITKSADRTRLLDTVGQLYGVVIFTGDPSRVKDQAQLEAMARHAQEVNYLGPILLARDAAARMQAASVPGAIVLFSTMQAVSLFPGSTAYAGAKASLQHAARLLAKECRGQNIRVNVIAPGATAAGMAEASIASGKYNHLIEQGLAPRFGRAEDVARAVRFFLEPDNYITGQVLSVDGGVTL
ncbi:MAG: SDR family oxidoreductase [Acidobacteria bacterium]|nr:SDR family oxidoreductase [Acidobacteriota bacterium]